MKSLNQVRFLSSADIYERIVCAVVVLHIFERLQQPLWGFLVDTFLLSLAVIIYLCLMVLRKGTAGALSARCALLLGAAKVLGS